MNGLGTTLGIGLTNFATSLFREEKAREEQFQYNEQAANNADLRSRKLYMDFMSPNALRQQYQEAGLSPSLLFGGGGIGGQTPNGAQGNGSNQGTIYTPISPVDAAQIELMKAQAKKEEEEANRLAGKNQLGKAEINKLIADTENQRVQTQYTRVQSNIAEIDEYIAKATAGNKINISNYELERAIKEVDYLNENITSAKISNKVSKETIDDAIQQIRLETYQKVVQCKLMELDTQLKDAGISLTNAQIQDISSQIATRADEIKIKAYEYELNRQNTEFNWNIETNKFIVDTEMKLKELGIKKAEVATRIASTLAGALILKH